MQIIKDLINGAIIGIANIIPGVSGGTMALVLGFYEKLIAAIHNISLNTVISFFKLFTFKKENLDDFKAEFKKIDGLFLVNITLGALIAIILLAKIMTFLLRNHHDPTYGFFFGLVLLSAIAPYKMIKKKTIPVFISFVIALTGVMLISNAVSGDKLLEKAKIKYEMKLNKANSVEDSTKNSSQSKDNIIHLVYIFFLGAISISAMILPGVSGSFLMLLLGGYFEILKAISQRDVVLLGVFAAGCILGIIFFTRILNFLLNKWHDSTMSFLVGLVIGSLWMIWPFKTTAVVGDEIIYLTNTFPTTVSKIEIYTFASIITGMIIVGIMLYMESRNVKN